jgi:hypothetical protein
MATNSIPLAAFAVLLVSPVFGQQTDPPTFAPEVGKEGTGRARKGQTLLNVYQLLGISKGSD